MQRQIKFRGKTLSGEWVYGFIALTKTYPYGDNDINAYIWKIPCVDNCIAVDPATVGQFTGLCDKNGKEIYEGDIVKHNAFGIKLVKWGSSALPCQEAAFMFDRTIAFLGSNESIDTEVIGNIHANPELLEVSTNE